MSSKRDGRRRRRGAPPSMVFPLAGPEPGVAVDIDAAADLLFGAAAPEGGSAPDAPAGADHKLAQLCAQVGDALALALASARDGALRDLAVSEVVPLRGAARLEVRLTAGDEDPLAAERAVRRALGWLRSEVGDAIARKRVPELVVVVVPGDAVWGDDDEEVSP